MHEELENKGLIKLYKTLGRILQPFLTNCFFSFFWKKKLFFFFLFTFPQENKYTTYNFNFNRYIRKIVIIIISTIVFLVSNFILKKMKICSLWCTKSASTRLLWIMIPFILVSIFFAFGNLKNSSFSTSTWFFSSG